MPLRLPTPPAKYDPQHAVQTARAIETYTTQADAALKTPVMFFTPSGSADPTGTVGSIACDGSFLYIKTAAHGWVRAAVSTF